MLTVKRVRRSPSDAKLLILSTAERIMLEEGYASVTIRHVGKIAAISSTLIHYYYPTLDDMLLALFQHTAAGDLEQLRVTLDSDDLISALWEYQLSSDRMALGVEFLALANHKKVIRAEMVRIAEKVRRMEEAAVSKFFEKAGFQAGCSSLCLATLLTSVARNLTLERGVGITLGHPDAREYVSRTLHHLIRRHKR